MKTIKYSKLNKIEQQLLFQAEQAMDQSYAPYSNLAVGATLLTKKGEIIPGTNMENGSLGLTICAERNAVALANLLGYREYTALALIAKPITRSMKNKKLNELKLNELNNNLFLKPGEIIRPCGACLQVLSEFVKNPQKLKIILSNSQKTKIQITNLKELLPNKF